MYTNEGTLVHVNEWRHVSICTRMQAH